MTNANATCPCCFGSFVVRNAKMVLHGYKRPGIGYIILCLRRSCGEAGQRALPALLGQPALNDSA